MEASGAAPGIGVLVFFLAFIVLLIASGWKLFTKAGQPGWAILVPIYNAYIMCKIAGKPGWWLLLLMIPFVNIIFMILLYLGLAQNFGKGPGFAVGLLLLSPIFLPILAFGSATYVGQGGAQPAVAGA